jgi:hypothetical protein
MTKRMLIPARLATPFSNKPCVKAPFLRHKVRQQQVNGRGYGLKRFRRGTGGLQATADGA